MLLMMMMAMVVVGCWWWWDENKDSTADGKGSRPTSYIYPSLLSICERWKRTSYYSSVESHLQAFLNSEFKKHVWAPSSNQFWMGEEQDRETRGNTQVRASPPVNESFPATHPQYDEFMNQSMSFPGSSHRPVNILGLLFSFSQNVYWDPNQPTISHLSETQKCFSIWYC